MQMEDISDSAREWLDVFRTVTQEKPDMATAVAAIHTLIKYIEKSEAETIAELRAGLTKVIQCLTRQSASTITSVSSGCELFLRFITLKAVHSQDFAECKRQLADSGKEFLERATQGRDKVAKTGLPFIRDGTNIITHSYSRVVMAVLLEAARANRRFTVYVTEALPSGRGKQMAEELERHGIPVVPIRDAAVGYVMEKMDFAIIGAEAVAESGGVVNTVGSYQIAVLCKTSNKPFYVVAESFKFVRVYPLTQSDIPCQSSPFLNPVMDYTPPSYISLLFTDIGVLTPSAVSDELIKLYL
eukprot:m.111423 g.111423  ORF g.111423 m.111423 type:complete len:300 (+) comp51820_c1_seq8:665-1564(+)